MSVDQSDMFEKTSALIRKNTAVAIPISVLGAGLMLFIGWTYTIDIRVNTLEGKVERQMDDTKEIKKMVRWMYERQLKAQK